MEKVLQRKPAGLAPPVPSPPARPRTKTDAPARGGGAAGSGHDFARIPIHPPAQRAGDVQRTAERGVGGAGREFPHLAAIQRAFGRHDVSGVRAHVGGPAASASEALHARAYATGGRVAFRQEPSLHTAAHEAAHVVQQRGGTAPPGGVGRAGDRHERHAEAVADRVAQGQSAEALLDAYAPAGASPRDGTAAVQMQDDPTLTPHKKQGKISVYELKEGSKTSWIDPYKIAFLGGGGWDVFLWARAKGYSTFAALFIMAHATLESDFGRGNYGAEYKNLFSIMGGPATNKGTAHGHLQSYATYAEGLEAYATQLQARWSDMVAPGTGLYFKSSFTPDEVNRAFRQYNHYGKGGGVYLGDKSADYGAQLFGRMEFIAAPFIALLGEKISDNLRAMGFAFEQAMGAVDSGDRAMWEGEVKAFQDIDRQFRAYLAEVKKARADAAANLAAHKGLKAAGTIKAP